MLKPKIVPGNKYNKLTVVKFVRAEGKHRFLKCKCECGNKVIVRATSLTSGNTKSCGCIVGKKIIHGGAYDREYRIWQGMWQRCTNSRCKAYPDYGGRGIKVCGRWGKYANFIFDMGKCPNVEMSLDRVNNDDDYRPGNCRWATRLEQNNNRRPYKKKCSKNWIPVRMTKEQAQTPF